MPDEQSCANLLFFFFSPSRPSPLLHIRTHTQCSGPVATRPARPSRPWRNHNQSGPLPHQMPSPRPQDGGRSTPQPGILQPPQQHNPQLRKSSSPATRGLPPALVLIWPNCQHQLFYSDVRTKPSPSFNTASRNNVEPLADKSADMDESYVLTPPPDRSGARGKNHVDSPYRFIGKTGGEIFHEMMLRQKVEHICKPPTQDWAAGYHLTD